MNEISLISSEFEHKCLCRQPISIDEQQNPFETTALKCGHVFHSGCIEQSLEVKALCPHCSAPSDLVGRISIQETDLVKTLYTKIAERYGFVQERFSLFQNQRYIPESYLDDYAIRGGFTYYSVGMLLKSGDQLLAVDTLPDPARRAPTRRITLDIPIKN